jgi:hypothetical protein
MVGSFAIDLNATALSLFHPVLAACPPIPQSLVSAGKTDAQIELDRVTA